MRYAHQDPPPSSPGWRRSQDAGFQGQEQGGNPARKPRASFKVESQEMYVAIV